MLSMNSRNLISQPISPDSSGLSCLFILSLFTLSTLLNTRIAGWVLRCNCLLSWSHFSLWLSTFCMCMSEWACAHACEGGGQPQRSFLRCWWPCFLRQGPSLAQNALSRSSWLQQASGITGIVSMCYHLRFWGSNSGPRAWKERSSLTKPSPCLPLSPLLRLDLHCSQNSGWRRGRERQEAVSLQMST